MLENSSWPYPIVVHTVSVPAIEETKVKEDEKFAVWIAGATLRSGDREVDALALDDPAQQAAKTGDLDKEIKTMGQFDRKGGDFGAEIIGAVVIPILIEAGKQLWASYFKKVSDKAAGALADATASQVTAFVKEHWSGTGDSATAKYEQCLRDAAAKQGLSQPQTEALVKALRSPEMKKEIAGA
jgi:hypothetical protein